jgi:hypothetical protein
MSIAWWILKATDMRSEYVILIDSSKATMVRRTRLIVRLYVHRIVGLRFVILVDGLLRVQKKTLVLSYQSARPSRIQTVTGELGFQRRILRLLQTEQRIFIVQSLLYPSTTPMLSGPVS